MAESPSAPRDLTILLHTRNRAADLAQLLDRLRGQETHAAFSHDVLVVDNGSSDDTRHVVERAGTSFPVPLHYAEERRVGRPYALNAGLALITAPIVAFTDDDALPLPTWLQVLWRCMVEEQAQVVGGRVLPLWLDGRPPWLTDEAVRGIGRLGCLDQGELRQRSRDGLPCRWFTSNVLWGRDALLGLGGWDETLRYYQDTDLHRRAREAGLTMVYEPAAVVHHKIGAERLTLNHFRRRRRLGAGYSAQRAGWRARHWVTVMPLRMHLAPWRAAVGWLGCVLAGDLWWRRFERELQFRDDLGVVLARLRLWLARLMRSGSNA